MAIVTAAASVSLPRRTLRRSSSATAQTARPCLARPSGQSFPYLPKTSFLLAVPRSTSRLRRAAIVVRRHFAENAEHRCTPLHPMRQPRMASDSDALMNARSFPRSSRFGLPPPCRGSTSSRHFLEYLGSNFKMHLLVEEIHARSPFDRRRCSPVSGVDAGGLRARCGCLHVHSRRPVTLHLSSACT